ncbi:dihydroorotase [Bifidobacterium gallicum]|uniref:Amidohydrolase family protein n=1 Tax=Bifidobacterium gallicum DSM 20093 = LMG 11596 TaxID=561180 RepID=D1NSH6_9BIFI|nr:dihydroorotase [Bifidobacterium gallicum]EFA23628.1 amidohydrolase family protein [Bifidobacterium gallicum DSM 20093 = LMG 11596]KFI58689.1 dihydroorotase [Bifidobacterium gallicum DSM 20093 = LMG 11596]
MALTLTNIRVWNTGERIDLVVPTATRTAEGQDVADLAIDATAFTLAPGLADPHVHFRDPGQTYKEDMMTGTRAAASGGYTQVLIMPNTEPAMDGRPVVEGQPGAQEVLDAGCINVIDYLQQYDTIHDVQLPVHYDLCVSATKGRAGAASIDAADIRPYLRANAAQHTAAQLAHPVTAVSDDGAAVPTAVLDDVFATIEDLGLYLIEHCEHHDTGAVNDGPVARELGVPGIAEDTELAIVARDIEHARRTGLHVHFQHISTAIAFDAIRQAKAEGLPVTCETAPHYIALCDESLLEYGTLAKMNPPLRSAADRQAVLDAIADGTVDMIATDHAPHTLEEKQLGFLDAPNGIIGLECAYGVCHQALVSTGIITEERLIELMSVNPHQLMGRQAVDIPALLEQHGSELVGLPRRRLDLTTMEDTARVDMVVLDTQCSWSVQPDEFLSKARNTPFAGWQVTGRPMATIVDGQATFTRIPGTAPLFAVAQGIQQEEEQHG